MLKLETPEFLYLLILIPFFFVAHYFYLRSKKRKLKEFASAKVQEVIMPELSIGKQRLKFVLLNIAFALLVFAAANPQYGTSVGKKERRGTDLVICLDISNSMLAEDLKPNRISRAKQSINQLINQLQGDRIGLVVFAGTSFVQLPVTSDYSAAKTFIDVITPEMITTQGTAIGESLQTAFSAFGQDENKKRSRSIVLISDGEDNEEDALKIAKDIAAEGVVINTIGLGLGEGSPIPIKNRNGQIEYKRDRLGNIVLTKLNEELLKQIAEKGNGIYIRANNSSIGLEHILARINKMEKNEYEALAYKNYESRFYIPAMFALLLLLMEYFIFERKNKYINRKFFFGK